MKVRTLASLALLTLAANASAQLYKYVGPDGKIVYADRPPVAPMPNVQVFSAGVPRAVGPEERGYLTQRKVEPPPETPVRRPVAASSVTTAASADPEVRARELAPLLPALRAAVAETTLVDRTVDLCILALPRSYKRYVGAQDAWKGRNGAVTARVNALLSDVLPGDERLRLEQDALEYTSGRLQAVRATPPGKRIAWCDQTSDEISGGKFDLAGIPGIQALMQYQPH